LKDPTQTLSPSTADPVLHLPDDWETTAAGLRSTDGSHAIDGLQVGSDGRGERLLVKPLNGTGPVTSERTTDDLYEQLRLAARRLGIDEPEKGALRKFAADLEIEIRHLSDTAREVFYGQLVDGDLYELLSGGIGPRHPHNIADVMREGPRPKPMLLKDWLVAAELHWVAAEPAAGKTWFGLWMAWQVIENGGVVVWADEELGDDTFAERLLALGADPDRIEKQFVYLPYPGWDATPDDVRRWGALVKAARPDLTVIDTATDALAEAGLDENSGIEVTQWVKAYCEPPRRVGSAVLVLDHIVKSGSTNGYAIGSRAKKAKTKVQFSIKKKEDFNAAKTGRVEVTLTKLGVNGVIPEKRTFNVGGDGAGRFRIEQENTAEAAAASGEISKATKEDCLKERLVKVICEQGPLTAGQIKAQVTGKAQATSDALAELAESSLHQISATKKGNSVVYAWTGEGD
jgi:AAA domain